MIAKGRIHKRTKVNTILSKIYLGEIKRLGGTPDKGLRRAVLNMSQKRKTEGILGMKKISPPGMSRSAMAGRARSKRKGKGRGWHGDSVGHAAAARKKGRKKK